MSCISLILKSLHRINHEISCWIFALKERTDHTRFARGTSQTFQALEGLVDKGVKVDIGIPKELWHKPSAEVSHLKTQVRFSGPTGFSHCSDDYAPTSQCETLLEEHEEDIEEWYFKRQEEFTLEDFLCRQRALSSEADKYCLGKAKGESAGIKSKRKAKKKKKDKDEL